LTYILTLTIWVYLHSIFFWLNPLNDFSQRCVSAV